MSASAILGYALVGISDQSGVIAAVVTGVCLIVAQLINSASESRRHKRELRSRNGGSGGSGVSTGLLLGMLISVGALIYFSQRSDGESQASAGPAPPTAITSETEASSSAAPSVTGPPLTTAPPTRLACPAFAVQIAARETVNGINPTFLDQAASLAQSVPQFGELHFGVGQGCRHAEDWTLYYFGPFADEESAKNACLAIGQIMHDNVAAFSQFMKDGNLEYPFYRDELGRGPVDSIGTAVLCSPDA